MGKTILGRYPYAEVYRRQCGVVCRLIMASSRMFFCVHMEEQPLLCVMMIVSC